ncbi:protein takeout-like [Prorops nasuta]|uniref:protein takeout-like n=1 Tax=Prorops nasuta TaxID=863751 RepID=UPI0034CEA7A4
MAAKWHEAINWPNAIEQQRLGPPRCSRHFGELHIIPEYRAVTPQIQRSLRRRLNNMIALHIFACVAFTIFGGVFGVLPPYIKPCRRNDPDLNRCITNSIEQLRGKLAEGIPELESPPIEPLHLKEVRLLRGPAGARLDVNLSDIVVTGPSNFKVRDLKADPENVVFTFKVSFTKLNFRAKYEMNTRVLLLQFIGAGDLTGEFLGYDSDVVMKAKKVFRNNDTYLSFDKMRIRIKIGKANIHLSNLFNGDPVLGAAGNEVLNSNSELFVDELRPVLEASLAELFTNVANKITKSFTYNELFPL